MSSRSDPPPLGCPVPCVLLHSLYVSLITTSLILSLCRPLRHIPSTGSLHAFFVASWSSLHTTCPNHLSLIFRSSAVVHNTSIFLLSCVFVASSVHQIYSRIENMMNTRISRLCVYQTISHIWNLINII